MRRSFSPGALRAPFGRYQHAMHVTGASEWLVLSGLLPLDPEGNVPEGVTEQSRQIFAGIDASLAEAGLARRDVVQLSTFLVTPEDRLAYTPVRDAWVVDPLPASTVIFVQALAIPGCRVEIEALAARG